jgi:hypothetical protein
MTSTLDFAAEISGFMAAACKALYWHEGVKTWPQKSLQGGSCFVLRLPGGLVGVTAAHVVAAYRTAQAEASSLVVCQLGYAPFNLSKHIIDLDDDLDIATFAVSQSVVDLARIAPLDCTVRWPPPAPRRGSFVTLIGFPELLRRSHPGDRVEFQAYGGFTAVEDVTERDIMLVYDPSRERPLAGVPELPPLHLNLSGASGGLVFEHEFRNGLFNWWPVGLIVKGPGAQTQGLDIDMIVPRQLRFVRADGSIVRAPEDWLPPR